LKKIQASLLKNKIMSQYFRVFDLQAASGNFTGILTANAGITANTSPITANAGITANTSPITANAGITVTAGASSFNARPKVNGTNVALITDISDDSQPHIESIYINDLGLQDDKFDLFVEGAKIGDFGSGADSGGRDWEIKYSTAKRGYLMRFRNADTSAWSYALSTAPTERKRTLYLKTNNDGGGSATLRFKTTTQITINIVSGDTAFVVSIYPVNNNLFVDGVLTDITTSANYFSKFLTFDVDVDLESGTALQIAQRVIKFTDIASNAADWV
jgi:hypothetical protein